MQHLRPGQKWNGRQYTAICNLHVVQSDPVKRNFTTIVFGRINTRLSRRTASMHLLVAGELIGRLWNHKSLRWWFVVLSGVI
ncbi:hypothetical protein Plhal304r1_c098g0174281 [Plasmopara halstedii]